MMSGVAADMMGWEDKHVKHPLNCNSSETIEALPSLALKIAVFCNV
jgi:hypothetical protein